MADVTSAVDLKDIEKDFLDKRKAVQEAEEDWKLKDSRARMLVLKIRGVPPNKWPDNVRQAVDEAKQAGVTRQSAREAFDAVSLLRSELHFAQKRRETRHS